jgi:hypothetical protein
VGRYIIELERDKNSSSVSSAVHFYFYTIGQLNYQLYERVHDTSFWYRDTFSIVLRNNKFDDDDDDDTSASNLSEHLLELMKHCRFNHIDISAYKHNSFVRDLIYTGLTSNPDIAQELRSLSINCYCLPQTNQLYHVLLRCPALKKLKVVYCCHSSQKAISEETSYVTETSLEDIEYDFTSQSNPELKSFAFIEKLIQASPHLKRFKVIASCRDETITALAEHCPLLEEIIIHTYEYLFSETVLLQLCYSCPSIRHFEIHSHISTRRISFFSLREITRCWHETLETFIYERAYDTDIPPLFYQDDDRPETILDNHTLTRCEKLRKVSVSIPDRWMLYRYYNHFNDNNVITSALRWIEKLLGESCTSESLRELTLKGFIYAPNSHPNSFTQNLSKLKVLTYYARQVPHDLTTNIAQRQAEHIMSVLTSCGPSLDTLEILDLDDHELVDQIADLIADVCHNLKHLTVELNSKRLEALFTLKTLVSLTATVSKPQKLQVDDDHVLPNLRHLKISPDSNEGLKKVLQCCSNIHSLTITKQIQTLSHGIVSVSAQPTIIVGESCHHLKSLTLSIAEMDIPIHENFSSLCTFENVYNSYTIENEHRYYEEAIETVLAIMICCTELTSFKLEHFMKQVKVKELISYILRNEMEDYYEEPDDEVVWKLFMRILQTRGQRAVKERIIGDKNEQYLQMLEYAGQCKDEYQERATGVASERGWRLTLTQLYEMIRINYPMVKEAAIPFNIFL